MTGKKLGKPVFFKALSEPAAYGDAQATVKFHESEGFWIFKTGPFVYKVIKPEASVTSKVLVEAHASELAANSNRMTPSLEATVLGLVEELGSWVLRSGLAPGAAPYYVIKERQLADRGFLDQMLEKGKLKEKHLAEVAAALWRFHETAGLPGNKDLPGAEILLERLKDRFYQAKKFLGKTITKTMIDLSTRPLEKYLEDHKKLLGQRTRKGFVGHYHGALELRKIHWTTEGVAFLGRSGDPMKERYGDRTSDLADLIVDLENLGQEGLGKAFLDAYLGLSKDQEALTLLPLYKALKVLKQGLKHSIAMDHAADPELERAKAKHYFERTVSIVSGL
ncbi:MAG: hypothetical protein A2600_07220 [Candidatus Lambdaproteobacteria bacterium RIFOXYD1_FULL_56_27]|uniref:Aminoglycoside phosphotransferase domain-containing protein n=1 Tax=Candidatus Lambdaproteobacteria bacterium RIFOXYD2_FULL_56_26 TaxID=1817773 RepID=A0A1F6GQF4_9PROT|nr:MAG: hypothetical protein A2557_05880 [Candidatus Lambdaproteobacteria bacterium RIFOXYD2_FULL_56_26]OGH03722.1 MAG: hypothetical protein A2426_00670 [Candidatus Lambdaproteobacteria bacterium RIFOXYC1_FULL_56_13]OGH07306.1 MAG: hypothetical protein A2600_07220 [Candidatus Lambdaproteobacteria bacterium RIFOXYD1_FULL_56_27]